MTRVGVIADTHGLLRAEALAALAGSNLILHAGDMGSSDIIPALESIAPVRAVRGNVDGSAATFKYPLTEALEVENISIVMYHGHEPLGIDPLAGGFALVISGHSHRPELREENGVTFLNPGSAGPKRFSLPVCLARVTIDGSTISAELVYLNP